MSTDSAATSAKRGPRPRFTRDEVLRTAMRLIDEGEPGSFSMRRLADELGVGVMTLYGYVANKEELYAGVTALAFGEMAPTPEAGSSWHDDVRAAVRELHGICLRHPNLLSIVLADTTPDPSLFRRRERILTALREAGFPRQKALHALGVLYSYALGFAVAGGARGLHDVPPEIRAERSAEFPGLAEAADGFARHLDPEVFEYGLDLLLNGLRAEISG